MIDSEKYATPKTQERQALQWKVNRLLSNQMKFRYEHYNPSGGYTDKNKDFYTWNDFGLLWKWVDKQPWFEDFLNIMDVGEYISMGDGKWTCDIQAEFVCPETFANAVYEYLKENS